MKKIIQEVASCFGLLPRFADFEASEESESHLIQGVQVKWHYLNLVESFRRIVWYCRPTPLYGCYSNESVYMPVFTLSWE